MNRRRIASVLNLASPATRRSPCVLERPSSEICTRMDGTRTEDQIVDEPTAPYDAPRDQIAADMHAFRSQLLELHLIEDVDDADTPQEGPANGGAVALD